jgi:hypothetical protein
MADTDFAEAEQKRNILRRVAAYRDLCNRVRRSSTTSIVFGGIMLAFWYGVLPEAMKFQIFGLIYLGLAMLEFGTGLLNRFFPSAEGVLLEGVVLFAFGGWNLGREILIWQGILPGRFSAVFAAFGGWWLFQGLNVCRSYFGLRRLFALRPSSEHIRWFEQLVREIRTADPKTDPQALMLPSEPYLSAKLLGDTAIFLFPDGQVEVLARSDVRLDIEPTENPERPRGVLMLGGYVLRPFPLSRANWENYQRWKSEEIDDLPEARILSPR